MDADQPATAARYGCESCGHGNSLHTYTARCMVCGCTVGLSLTERVTAWLSFKLSKRPGNATLAYCVEWAATPSLRHEAARLLAKRRVSGITPEPARSVRRD